MSKNTLTTAQYQPVDIVVKGSCALSNPFFADLHGIFDGPGGCIVVPGFYDGNSTWKVRFSPTAIGSWSYTLSSPHIALETSGGTVTCVANRNATIHGAVQVMPNNPHHFQFEDGTPYFMMAYEADWLWALGFEDPTLSKLRELLGIIKGYGFNQIIMQVYAHDAEWCHRKDGSRDKDYGPPPLYAWEGTNEQPNHDRPNVAYYRNLDRVMQCLLDEGFTAHLFFKVYNKHVNWPAPYSPADNLYFKYVTARYQAFPNVIWDYSKESYHEQDKEYLVSRLAIVRANDGYRRLTTVHDDRLFYGNPRHAALLDFATLQQHNDFYTSALYERRLRAWPIFNSEFGYEHGPGGIDDYFAWSTNTTEDFIDRAYQIVMAGAYIAYYYNYTAWNIIDWSYTPPGYQFFKILHDFFSTVQWWAFEPRRDICRNDRSLCLARPDGREYIFYVSPSRAADLPAHLLGDDFTATWMDIRTGQRSPAVGEKTALSHFSRELWVFRSPFADAPGILHIRRA